MPDAVAGHVIAGKYRLVRRLSAGGMGAVWLGHHLQLDAPVAVKFMHPSLAQDTTARMRFEREAKSAAQIRSPHIVHVYDHGVDGDHPFLVMELLEGQDLAARLRGNATLSIHEAARVCDEICKGLGRAHALGIVHRDLKPGNVFLSAPDDDMIKLLDFGIAKETGTQRVVEGETTGGQLLGSPQYLSPEQARGQPVDARSDLWSLGVILYRALTGACPFEGSDIGDIIVRICMEEFVPATAIRPDIPPGVDDFFAHVLCREPSGRFASARELAAAFRTSLGLAPAESPSRAAERAAGSGVFVEPTPLPSAPYAVSVVREDTLSAATVNRPRARARLLAGGLGLAVVACVVAGVIVAYGSASHAPVPASEPPSAARVGNLQDSASASTVTTPITSVAAEAFVAPAGPSSSAPPNPHPRQSPAGKPKTNGTLPLNLGY